MGAGLGHVRRLVTVARALREDGWEPYFALRSLHTLPEQVAAVAAGVLQTPGHLNLAPRGRPFEAVTYADIMGVCGYADRDALRAVVRGWDSLLALIRPDVVLADYSPLLHLAAFGRVPVVPLGDGFCVPPDVGGGFARIRERGDPVWPAGRLLENARAVALDRGGPAPDSLPRVMSGQAAFVCVVPALDVYRSVRAVPGEGALEGLPAALPAVPDDGPPGVFVYLPGNYAYTPLVLQAAVAAGLRVEGYLHPPRPDLARELAPRGVRLYPVPQPLGEALARARAIVHHGGVGTTEQALALGRPQLIVPKTLEQGLNAGLVGGLGVGLSLGSRQRTPESVGAAILRVASDGGLRAGAAQAAAGLDRAPSLPRLVALCRRLASSPGR
jgi:UDP:flavonoid glycosyltransferase YjiC (YdhE family)